MTLFTIACLLALIACLTPFFIPSSPTSRNEMGVRLSDDDFEWIDLNEEDWNRIKNEFNGSNS